MEIVLEKMRSEYRVSLLLGVQAREDGAYTKLGCGGYHGDRKKGT